MSNTSLRKAGIGVIAIGIYFILIALPTPEGLTYDGKRILAFMAATIIFWIFEVVPIGITSVCSLMLMPLLGISTMGQSMQNFGIPTVFFIMASFCFASGFIGTGFAKRVSLELSKYMGTTSKQAFIVMMMSTCVISFFLADIPTAIIFASIAHPILQANNCVPGKSNFGMAMMIGIPMASAIGGFAVPSASGLNIMALDLLQKHCGVTVNFLQWCSVGIPFAIMLTLCAIAVLLKMLPFEMTEIQGMDDIAAQRRALGPMNAAEKKFCIIFGITIILWVTSYWTHFNLAAISVCMATLLFLPGINVLSWENANKSIAWDVLLIVGTSSSLAAVMQVHGAATWIANSILGHLGEVSLLTILFLVIMYGIFSHYILPVANATLAVSIPVIAVLAHELGINPAIIVVPLAYTASCVFLLPVDPIPLTTFKYGYWKITDMMKPGLVVSVIWGILLTGVMYLAAQLGVF